MTFIAFTLIGEPVTKGRARFARRGKKVITYTPANVMDAEARVAAEYLRAAGRSNKADDKTAFVVTAEFHMVKRQRRDVDNLLKLVLDGLNQVAWADDSQVIQVVGRKVYNAEDAKTVILVERAGEVPRPVGICEECRGEFPKPPSHSAKKYCSQKCRSAALRARRERTCIHCGDEFLTHGTVTPQVYCSSDCAYAAKHVEVSCIRCGTAFMKARSSMRHGNSYCSDECKATYWRDRRKSAAKGACQDCGGPTTKKTYLRCRDCSYAAGGRHAYQTKDETR